MRETSVGEIAAASSFQPQGTMGEGSMVLQTRYEKLMRELSPFSLTRSFELYACQKLVNREGIFTFLINVQKFEGGLDQQWPFGADEGGEVNTDSELPPNSWILQPTSSTWYANLRRKTWPTRNHKDDSVEFLPCATATYNVEITGINVRTGCGSSN